MDPERKAELDSILRRLTTNQLKFVRARLSSPTDADAAREIGLVKGTVYAWWQKSPERKIEVQRAIQLLNLDGVAIAHEVNRRAVATAAEKIVELLDNPDALMRFRAATDILDRAGVKGPANVEVEAGSRLAELLKKAIAPWSQSEKAEEGEGRE